MHMIFIYRTQKARSIRCGMMTQKVLL